MPRLPRNMTRRGAVYQLRVMHRGRLHRESLGSDFTEACHLLKLRLAAIRRGDHHEAGQSRTTQDRCGQNNPRNWSQVVTAAGVA